MLEPVNADLQMAILHSSNITSSPHWTRNQWYPGGKNFFHAVVKDNFVDTRVGMLKLVWIPNIAQLEPAKEHFVFLSFIITLLGVFISAIDYLHDHNVLGRYIFGRASFRSNWGEGL